MRAIGGFVFFFQIFCWVFFGICGSFAERKPPGLRWSFSWWLGNKVDRSWESTWFIDVDNYWMFALSYPVIPKEWYFKIWVCLKIVYPYTQWLMIIIPLLNGYNWGYTPFSDIPICIITLSSLLFSCCFFPCGCEDDPSLHLLAPRKSLRRHHWPSDYAPRTDRPRASSGALHYVHTLV